MHAAILGATGYTGSVLLRLLTHHNEVDKITAVSGSLSGTSILTVDPGLDRRLSAKTEHTGGCFVSVEQAVELEPDVVFAALPHLTSARICAPFFGTAVVIDLSADFRLRDQDTFKASYGEPIPRPDLLPRAVYGLSEIYRNDVRSADIIANPGCFPTCILLPLLPVLRGCTPRGTIVANALTGISGAGKKAVERNLYVTRTENACAYNPGRMHRHTSEIYQEVKKASSSISEVFFFPHLVPMKRGMAATIHLETDKELSASMAGDLLRETYRETPFVRVRDTGIPETADVWGSNRCDIGYQTDGRHLMLFSVIDNLVKGASGQAVQNMNIRFGFEDTAGLPVAGEL